MENKQYMVKIKMIHETEMMVSEKSMQKAVSKIDRVLTDYVKNKISLKQTFTETPEFKYKVEKMK